ncbi:MAG TPA: Ig-like domain-containing protein, partial [Acidimicrobiales bacterium]|nr:Ig-like domain-containing protein [Acidimicrobiales bacterium]
AALAALALVGAACSDDGDDTVAGEPTQEGDAGEGGAEEGAEDGEMTISITAPGDGDTVEPGFDVQVEPTVDVGEPDTGLHHVHLYYDGNTSDGEYDIVYSADEPWTVEQDLDPGEHTVEAVIANADHSLTDASDEITVTVGEGAGAGGDTTTTSSDDPYDY